VPHGRCARTPGTQEPLPRYPALHVRRDIERPENTGTSQQTRPWCQLRRWIRSLQFASTCQTCSSSIYITKCSDRIILSAVTTYNKHRTFHDDIGSVQTRPTSGLVPNWKSQRITKLARVSLTLVTSQALSKPRGYSLAASPIYWLHTRSA